jgi:deoxyadenosine/deoxycytidine kinase
MSKLIAVVGASGVGKTAFVGALSAVTGFATAYEQHIERPFQTLFKNDARYALANQVDYFLLRAEQEKSLRASPQIGLIDGGLDLDFHGFTRLFHSRGLLPDPEFDLCRRVYNLLREFSPRPELLIRLRADEITVAYRLAARDRINIANAEDTTQFDSFLDEWLASIPADQVLELDVSNETLEYEQSVSIVLSKIRAERRGAVSATQTKRHRSSE